MVERLAIALALLLLGYLLYRLYGWVILRRRARIGLGLEEYELGRPAILYFTDPGCGPCLTVQDPALEQVASQLGDRLQIIRIQALERLDLTNSWGVLSLPTTFVIDAHGQPRGVNHGVANATRLLDQLASVGERTPQFQERTEPTASD